MQIKQLLKYERLNVELKSMLTISLLAGEVLVPGRMTGPVVCTSALTSYIRYLVYRNLQFLNHVIIVITKALLLNHVIIVITIVLLHHIYVTVIKSCHYCYI
jgi:hypothetical protein